MLWRIDRYILVIVFLSTPTEVLIMEYFVRTVSQLLNSVVRVPNE